MQKVGICHTNLDSFSPLEISACKLCTLKSSPCGTARCYHNTRYRGPELALSFVILDIFFFSTPFSFLLCTPSGSWPLPLHVPHLLPNKQDDFLLQLCAGQLKKEKEKRPRESVYEKTYVSYIRSTEWKSTPVVFLS